MSDELFNTLLAVVAMCGMHHSSVGPTEPAWTQVRPRYWAEPGYERCADADKALDAERVRRAAADAVKQREDEKRRLANLMAGLAGKPFTPESAPKALAPSCFYTIPTTQNDAVLR